MRTFEFYSTNYSTIIQADTLHLAIKEFMRRYPNDEILQIEDVASRESRQLSTVPSGGESNMNDEQNEIEKKRMADIRALSDGQEFFIHEDMIGNIYNVEPLNPSDLCEGEAYYKVRISLVDEKRYHKDWQILPIR